MRETRNAQCSIFDNYSSHPIGQHLLALSDLLDSYPALLTLVERDFRIDDTAETGASGLSVESVFRCLLARRVPLFYIKQENATKTDKNSVSGRSCTCRCYSGLEFRQPRPGHLLQAVENLTARTKL